MCWYRDSGSVDVEKMVPDTITKWAAGAFCVSSVGFGVSPNTGLTVFQPFFVSLTLPYSVVRGEVFTLKATVFNYLSKCIVVNLYRNLTETWESSMHISTESLMCETEDVLSSSSRLQVNVTLAHSEQYVFRNCDGCQYSVCLCGEESRTFSWIVTATALGTFQLTFPTV